MIFALSTPAIPKIFTTDFSFHHAGFESDTSHLPPRISVVIGTTTLIFRSESGLATDTTTQGRTFEAIPRSMITTKTRPVPRIVVFDLPCKR
jgi:hypothetical protein